MQAAQECLQLTAKSGSWPRVTAIALATATLTACGIAGRAIERNQADAAERVRLSTPAPLDRRACGATKVDVLTCDEKLWAEAAWKYVENNTIEATGLVSSTAGRPVVTMWDVADAIAATYSARELGLIDTCTFDARFGRIIAFLNTMPLVDGIAPNRWYDAATTSMVDASGVSGVVGWSAVDLGRLLVWLRIVEARHPVWSEYIGRTVARWNYCAIVDPCGTLNRGIHTGPGTNALEQEGRLGYEEYAAAGFELWGFDAGRAAELVPYEAITIEGVDLLHDTRDVPLRGSNALTTTPFAAFEMELGGALDGHDWTGYRQLGRDVARAQYERFRRTRTMTARGQRPLATPPWFVYDTVWASGYRWNTADPSGAPTPHFSILSTAAVFELWAAWPDEPATRMLDFTCSLRDPARGWLAGRFEKTGGADATHALRTNAAVLESILYRKFGTIFRAAREPGWFDVNARDEFFRPGRCLPAERRACGEECPPLRSSRPPREASSKP